MISGSSRRELSREEEALRKRALLLFLVCCRGVGEVRRSRPINKWKSEQESDVVLVMVVVQEEEEEEEERR